MRCRYCRKVIRRVNGTSGYWYEVAEGESFWLDKVSCKVKPGLHEPIPESEIVANILSKYDEN